MYAIVGTPHNISELKVISPDPVATDRGKVRIVLIDDEPFPYQSILHDHGFHVTKNDDIENIQSIEAYDIVLCDIKGVGTKLHPKLEGAHVISEIRKNYPFKYIIAYSGQLFDAKFNRYFQMADQFLKKDDDSEKWIEILDLAVRQTLDPHCQWQKMKKALFERDVPIIDIMRLEDEFVGSILKKNRNKFASGKALVHLSPETRELVGNFALQVLFKLLLGSR